MDTTMNAVSSKATINWADLAQREETARQLVTDALAALARRTQTVVWSAESGVATRGRGVVCVLEVRCRADWEKAIALQEELARVLMVGMTVTSDRVARTTAA